MAKGEQPIRTAPAIRYGSRQQQDHLQQMRRLPQQEAASPAGNPSPPSNPAGAAGQGAASVAARPANTSPDLLGMIASQATEFPGTPIGGGSVDPVRVSREDMRAYLGEMIRKMPVASKAMMDLYEELTREVWSKPRQFTTPSSEGMM